MSDNEEEKFSDFSTRATALTIPNRVVKPMGRWYCFFQMWESRSLPGLFYNAFPIVFGKAFFFCFKESVRHLRNNSGVPDPRGK